jgi:hypothetical protein
MNPIEEPKEYCKCPMCGQNQYDNGETGLDNPRILRHAFNALLPRYNAYPKLVEALKALVIELEFASSGNELDAGDIEYIIHKCSTTEDLLTELGEL